MANRGTLIEKGEEFMRCQTCNSVLTEEEENAVRVEMLNQQFVRSVRNKQVENAAKKRRVKRGGMRYQEMRIFNYKETR